MLRTPAENEPLGLWLEKALVASRDQLNDDMVRRSLGNQAEHAFVFDGVDFLISVLESWSDDSPAARGFVIAGVAELVANLGLEPGDRVYGAQDRQGSLVAPGDHTTASLEEALDCAQHFFLLARASLERTKFGGPERAADIALFETFRLAAIAVHADDTISPTEIGLLAHLMSWHQGGADEDGERMDLPAAFSNGIALVAAEVASFAHHSLVLRVTAANSTVTERLRERALDLMNTTLRLDGVNQQESDSILSTDDDPTESLAEDLALVADSIFIIPRGRGGHLPPDPEFDKLWALYRRAVPWSTPDRRTKRS